MLVTGIDLDFQNYQVKMILGNLFWFSYLKYSFAIEYSFNELLVNSSISQASANIVHGVYVKQTSAVVFTAGYVNEKNRLRQADLINEILQHSAKVEIKFRLQESDNITSTYSEKYNVIFIDSYEGFSWVKYIWETLFIYKMNISR